jgi:hypothetical protein
VNVLGAGRVAQPRCGEAGASVSRMSVRKKMLRDLWASAQISLKGVSKAIEFSWLRMA